MNDWPKSAMPPLVTITPYSLESMGSFATALGAVLSGTTSAAYPSANRAFYYPFMLSEPIVVVQLFSYNGAAASGNIDVGIYDHAGTRIVSAGSTAQAGTNALQAFDIADTLLGPGRFFLAIAKDDTTGTLFRTASGAADDYRFHGCYEQATAFPLPATATFATFATAALLPVFGLSTRTVL